MSFGGFGIGAEFLGLLQFLVAAMGMSPVEFPSQALLPFTILFLSEPTGLTATTLDTVLDDNPVVRHPTFDPGAEVCHFRYDVEA